MQLKNKTPTNKNFGIVFCFVFFIIYLEPIIRDAQLRYWSLMISLIFLILGLSNSKLLTPLNKIWFKFGILLGNFISPIVMGLVFFAVVTPTSFIMKAAGKDLLKLRKNKKSTKSYWIEKSEKRGSLKNQF